MSEPHAAAPRPDTPPDDGAGGAGGRRRRWPGRALAAVGLVAVGAVIGSATAVATHSFTDVPDTHPFHEDIGWLADQGIADGYGDGTFHPGDPLTRQAAAAMLRRLAGADPAVSPSVTAESVEAEVVGLPNTTIIGTTSQSATTVGTVTVEPGTYVVQVAGEFYTSQTSASLICSPFDTSVERYAPFGADLEGSTYRDNEMGQFVVTENNGSFDIRCWKSADVGAGDSSFNAGFAVVTKLPVPAP